MGITRKTTQGRELGRLQLDFMDPAEPAAAAAEVAPAVEPGAAEPAPAVEPAPADPAAPVAP